MRKFLYTSGTWAMAIGYGLLTFSFLPSILNSTKEDAERALLAASIVNYEVAKIQIERNSHVKMQKM